MASDPVNTMKRPDGSELCIGERIECDKHRGMLQFIGEIENMTGIWLGIDWDDASRGKHDGSYKGRRYFETKNPTSGSFITPKKAKLGISFHEAYQMKMLELNANLSRMFVLANHTIYGIGPPETIVPLSDSFSRVVDLDLSGNLLKSWDDVHGITVLIPTLTLLNLSHNRLKYSIVKDKLPKVLFNNIQELVMNHMAYNWSDILTCSSMFPNLRSLFVDYNDLSELVDSSGYLHKLERLSITNTHITEWKDVLKLGQLPELKILYANHNALLTTYFDDVSLEEGEKTKYFPKLERLDLNDNEIQHLSAIDELSKLSNLRNFSMGNNPLNNEIKELYLIIIGKLGCLETYAKSKISEADRKNGELYYLHMIAKQALANEWTEETMVKQHSRYKELVHKYGLPDPNALQQPSTNLKDKLIPVNVKSPNAPDKVFKQKKLSPTMTVLKLKSFVQRLFKITDIINMKLSYVSKRCPELEVDFDEDLAELRYYSLENDDTIIAKW